MQRFRNILVITSGKDGGKAAVEQAAALASTSPAIVKLVDAIEPLSEPLDTCGTEPAERHRELENAKLAHLERLADPLRQAGISVSYELLHGDAAEKAIERVIVDRHDLLLKSAEQPQGLAQRLFGTTGQRLLRKCPCPIWIIKTAPEPRLKRILVAVDPMPLEKNRNPMNVTIMELATSLANLNQCDLHVVYVWPKWTQWSIAVSSRDTENMAKHAQSESDSLQAKILERLVGPFRSKVNALQTHLLKGNPGDTIANLAQELDADLLVMGTVCRNNFVVFSIGRTAERVLNQVNCSVLAVKPDEFLSNVYPSTADGTGVLAW